MPRRRIRLKSATVLTDQPPEAESQWESRLAAALFDVAPPSLEVGSAAPQRDCAGIAPPMAFAYAKPEGERSGQKPTLQHRAANGALGTARCQRWSRKALLQSDTRGARKNSNRPCSGDAASTTYVRRSGVSFPI